MKGFKDLRVWAQAMDLVEAIYGATAGYPRRERFGLVPQTRNAAGSIPANIAEGVGRHSNRDFARFLRMAVGSANEVETHLLLAERLGYIQLAETDLVDRVSNIRRMLTGLINHLNRPSNG